MNERRGGCGGQVIGTFPPDWMDALCQWFGGTNDGDVSGFLSLGELSGQKEGTSWACLRSSACPLGMRTGPASPSFLFRALPAKSF
jgi:hypothetical protein